MAQQSYDIVLGDGEEITAVMATLIDGIGVEYTIESMAGPGGGHPTVLVKGDKDELERFDRRFADAEGEL